MITSNSRYVSNTLIKIKGSDAKKRTTIVQNAPVSTQFSYINHIVTGFDRLDNLAALYLGDPSLWWQIADVNPDITINWSVMPVGATIRIPVA